MCIRDSPDIWLEEDADAKPNTHWDPEPARDHLLVCKPWAKTIAVQLRTHGQDSTVASSLDIESLCHVIGVSPEVPMEEAHANLMIRYLRQAGWVLH